MVHYYLICWLAITEFFLVSWCLWYSSFYKRCLIFQKKTKGHSFCKQCLHDFHLWKQGLHNEWTLVGKLLLINRCLQTITEPWEGPKIRGCQYYWYAKILGCHVMLLTEYRPRLQTKSLFVSRAMSIFYGTELEI